MPKFLFLTDTHFRADPPKARIDDIYKAQFDELAEISEIVQEHGVDFIVHGGDFFNVRNPPHKLVGDLISWANFLTVPIYTIIGNHDVLGYNLDSVTNSGLGVLLEANAVKKLDLLVFEKQKVVIKAVHTSLAFKSDYVFSERYDSYTKIIISHNYVIPSDSMPFEFMHPKDILSNADLVLCGHYHVPFDYTSPSGTRWINPGALSRWSFSERDRIPTVLVVDTTEAIPFKYSVQAFPLRCSQEGSAIFDTEQVTLSKDIATKLQVFTRTLEKTEFTNVDIEQIVKETAKLQNIDASIVEKALLKIQQAKLELT